MLFERLAVFAGSFDVATAEQVCAGGEVEQAAVFELLVGLVRKSLVVRVDSRGPVARYRLLDTLREFAAERLGTDEAARRRHAAHFTAVMERAVPLLRGPGCVAVLDAVEREHAEFRAALGWLLDHDGEAACRLAAAVASFWDARFLLRTGRLWLERAAAAARTLPPSPAVLWTTVDAAYFAFMDSDLAQAASHCTAAEAMLGAVTDDRARTKLLLVRAEAARHADDLAGAQRLTEQAAAVTVGLGDATLASEVHRMKALVAADRGDFEAAIRHAQECLRIERSVSDIERTAGALGLLGAFLRERGYLDEATRLLEESLGGFQQVGEPLGMGFMLWQLAGLAVMRGDPDAAMPLAEHGLRISRELGFGRGTGQACVALADAELDRGRLGEAERWCETALARFAERGFSVDTITGLETATYIRLAQRDLAGAAGCADDALRAAREHGYEGLTGRVLCLVAAVQARQGDAAAATEAAEEARLLFERAGNPRGAARAEVALADAALGLGRADEASAHLFAARTILTAAGAALSWREQQELGRVDAALGPALL